MNRRDRPARTPTVTFDLAAYQRAVTPVRTDDLDLAAFRVHPLSPATLRCLRYMHDVESHTVCYLRDLLVTSSHADPRITTFLTLWNYEEHFHGEAIAQVLAAHDEASGFDRIAPMRAALGWKDRVGPFTSALGSAVIGEDFTALHMTWGAVNEWSTQAGYERLAAREGHPVLTALLDRIVRQESRHIAFYATEARERLARSRKAQRVTRWALRHRWAPVGSGVMPDAEVHFLLDHLMGGEDGRRAAARIDRNVHRLPGLDGLDIVVGALDGLGIPAADPACTRRHDALAA